MAKTNSDQFNLFGGTGKVSEEILAVNTAAGTSTGYLKCGICKQVSPAIQIPNGLLGDRSPGAQQPDSARDWALRQAGWEHECPKCEASGRCARCKRNVA